MSNSVAELDGLLQSMQELKPPGVSGPKIQAITSLCTSNIKDETVLIQKVYAHFKKAPNNKKLGVLYVVDSVSRQWLEQARKSGQAMGSGAADGTFAAGVNHVTELLPSLMGDIISVAPEEQKVKVKKLVDIWDRGNTFPAAMLSGFKQKLDAPAPQSTTPVGTPPKDFASAIDTTKSAAPNTASILANLQALANLKPSAAASGPAGNPAQGVSANNVSYPQTTFPQNVPSVNAAYSMQPANAAVNAPAPINGGVISYGMPQNMFPNGQTQQAMGQQQQQQQMPPNGQAMAGNDGLQQQLQILAALKAQGIPESQWPGLLTVLMQNQGANNASAAGPIPQHQPAAQNANQYGGRDDYSRDRNGYDQSIRSPSGRYRERSRSRSPRRGDRYRNDSPPRRGSPSYGEYNDRSGRDGDGNRRSARNSRGGNRQRSPNRNRRSASPQKEDFGHYERLLEYDPSLGEGMIKVLSRTLFVGGVTCPESELRDIFARFGRVQTCIVNTDKRHAFVKMLTRKEAERAKVELEHYKNDSMQLRTRWGVGFGPRPCSDYATGISVIPIDRLTEADRKWMLSAEYGGSGGRPIESGLVTEEPDIEIGAGVSSKAISRRMQTDKSGTMGPRSSRDDAGPGTGGRDRNSNNPNQTPLGGGRNQGSSAPAVPGFGFPFNQGGMPMYGGNFNMSGQPPPPGAS